MNTSQTVTATTGAALIGLNFWTGPQRKAFTDGALSSGASSAKQADAHQALYQLAAELLFVGVATLIAGAGGKAGAAMVAVFAALGVLWLIQHYSKGK